MMLEFDDHQIPDFLSNPMNLDLSSAIAVKVVLLVPDHRPNAVIRC